MTGKRRGRWKNQPGYVILHKNTYGVYIATHSLADTTFVMSLMAGLLMAIALVQQVFRPVINSTNQYMVSVVRNSQSVTCVDVVKIPRKAELAHSYKLCLVGHLLNLCSTARHRTIDISSAVETFC